MPRIAQPIPNAGRKPNPPYFSGSGTYDSGTRIEPPKIPTNAYIAGYRCHRLIMVGVRRAPNVGCQKDAY